MSKEESKRNVNEFFTQIAETTNSQKPIKASDLKSNTPEMLRLRRDLQNHGIDFQIKRGEKAKSKMVKIKNEEFGQVILSFVMQRPGTARSNKKALFENNAIYSEVFKKNYSKNKDMTAFIVDIIELNERFKRILEEIKKSEEINRDSVDIAKNGGSVLIALMGVLYRLQNQDIQNLQEVLDNPNLLHTDNFNYGAFISKYRSDDLDSNLKELLMLLIEMIDERYNDLFESNKVTSVSNYFKTDKRYQEDILSHVTRKMRRERTKKEILELSTFLKRE